MTNQRFKSTVIIHNRSRGSILWASRYIRRKKETTRGNSQINEMEVEMKPHEQQRCGLLISSRDWTQALFMNQCGLLAVATKQHWCTEICRGCGSCFSPTLFKILFHINKHFIQTNRLQRTMLVKIKRYFMRYLKPNIMEVIHGCVL